MQALDRRCRAGLGDSAAAAGRRVAKKPPEPGQVAYLRKP